MKTKILQSLARPFIEWQSCPLANFGSPSSREHSVRRIESQFLSGRPQPRILDVGGTRNGFIKKASSSIRHRVTIVNPVGSSAEYRILRDVPPGPEFDLIMMFGVLNELQPDYDIHANFQDARSRLAPGGVFLVAEPNHKRIKEYDCFRALLEVGFELARVQRRLDLRPGRSITKYMVFSAEVEQ